MKYLFTAIALVAAFAAECQEDYKLNINDSSISISLDKDYVITINGQKINFTFKQKDTLLYNDKLYSFKYPKAVNVSKKKLDVGIEQISILTAEGTGLLIQSYETLNPTTLNELMLSELTKESISYGYESIRTNYKKTITPGKEIEITKATLRYKDDVNIYEVASVGKKDSGILIVTIRMDDDVNNEGQGIIDLMWKSLSLKW